MNNHSPAPNRAKAALSSVSSKSTNCVVPVEPSVVPVWLTNKYAIAVPLGTITLFAPALSAIIVDKLCAGAVTVKLSVTEKFTSSLNVVVSFIVNVGT